MRKRRRQAHEVRKLPPGRADGASHQRTAQGRGAGGGYHVETEQHEDGEMRGYAALWRAVLGQQLMDAKSRSSKADARYNRHLAHHWLFDNEADFNMVCELAGLDPDVTRRKVHVAKERGFNWNARKPQLTKFEREEQSRMLRAELFEIGILPIIERPTRARRRGFATRGIEGSQFELTF